MTSTAFYRYENGFYHPQQPATAPWTRKHQNGTSVGGLLARLVEETPSPVPMRLARINVELMRATPLAPTQTRTRIIRDGKRMQLVEAELLVEGDVFASGLGLRVHEAEGPVEPFKPHGLAMPEQAPHEPLTAALGEGKPMVTRIVKGARGAIGPGAYWTRFNAALVEGEETSPSQTAIMACDAASIICAATGPGWQAPNIDLNLYFARTPRGEWILTDSVTEQSGAGYGLISTTLHDVEGAFGYAKATLLYSEAKPRAWQGNVAKGGQAA